MYAVALCTYHVYSILKLTEIDSCHSNPGRRCSLMKPEDVRQVTWQKETTRANENVATYSKRGPYVNLPFQGKVEFEDEGLQNCSIVIRGVSRGDESCYKCLFNTFPDGPIRGRTCLHVNVKI
uniref:Immunoglobulin V-set domain-containing protein n=1 Tax=Hucho hucho TaxID=62062 RepID=A0A4W5PBX4_9TELE